MTWQEIIRQMDMPLIQALVDRGYYLGTKEIKLDGVYLNDLFVTDEIIYQLKLFVASVQMSTSWPEEYQQKFLELLGVTGLNLTSKGFMLGTNPLLDEIKFHMKSAPSDFIKIYLNYIQELDHLSIKFGKIGDVDEFEVRIVFINSVAPQPLKMPMTSSLQLENSYLHQVVLNSFFHADSYYRFYNSYCNCIVKNDLCRHTSGFDLRNSFTSFSYDDDFRYGALIPHLLMMEMMKVKGSNPGGHLTFSSTDNVAIEKVCPSPSTLKIKTWRSPVQSGVYDYALKLDDGDRKRFATSLAGVESNTIERDFAPEYHYTEDFGVCPVIFSYDMVSSKVLILSPRTAICVQPNFSFVGPVFSTSFGLKVLVERLPVKREPEQTVPVNITYELSFGRRWSKVLDNIEDFLFSLGGIEVDYWLIPSELTPPTAKAGD